MYSVASGGRLRTFYASTLIFLYTPASLCRIKAEHVASRSIYKVSGALHASVIYTIYITHGCARASSSTVSYLIASCLTVKSNGRVAVVGNVGAECTAARGHVDLRNGASPCTDNPLTHAVPLAAILEKQRRNHIVADGQFARDRISRLVVR